MSLVSLQVHKVSKMSRNQSKEKKLAVLAIVKEKKHILFGSFQNNESTKKEKEEAWYEVLKKAQSIGLSSVNRQWSYARDHLFGLWKSRTLAKRYNYKKTGTGRGKSIVFDVVDEAILDILGIDSPVVDGLGLPEADSIATQPSPQQSGSSTAKPSTASKNTNAAKRKPVDALEEIKREVLESELYANKLKIFKFEKELGLPPSKFTFEFHNHIKKGEEITLKDGLSLDGDVGSSEIYNSTLSYSEY